MRSTARPAACLVALARLAPAALLSCAALGPAAAAAEALPTYEAHYRVEYRGRHVGSSEQGIAYDAARQTYLFGTKTRARGLARLIAPGLVTEESRFAYENGKIRPLEFSFEDGTRRGKDNLHIAFDWDRGIAVVTDADGPTELPLHNGVLDRGSMQVAVMRDMATPTGPDRYVLADADSLRTYEYEPAGEETVTTPAGEFRTVAFMQRREGSSRTMTVWAAPELQYLPVKIEQRRDGALQTALILESVEGLGDTAGGE